MVTRIHDSLHPRHLARLEVEIVVVVLKDDWKLNPIPDVPQSHLPAGQVRVEDTGDDLGDPAQCRMTCSVWCW